MINKLLDRRIGRTKRLLKSALLELIQLRTYESITVDQIADRADVGRSTFYSHFTSKDDLLFYGFDQFLMSLTEHAATLGGIELRQTSQGFRFSLPLLQHIQSQKKFFLATIVSASDLRVQKRTIGLFVKMIRLELDNKVLPNNAGNNHAAVVARAHAVAGAFLAVAGWWLEQAPDRSAEFVDGVFAEVVRPGDY